MAFQLITPPARRSVSVRQAATQLRLANTDSDSELDRLIPVAERHTEELAARRLINQTVRYTLDSFPIARTMWLALNPVQSVQIDYDDADDVEQTLSAAQYHVAKGREPARVTIKSGFDWPVIIDKPEAVRITIVVGVADPESVPDALRQAVLLLVAHLYRNRVPFEILERAAKIDVPLSYESLMIPYMQTTVV